MRIRSNIKESTICKCCGSFTLSVDGEIIDGPRIMVVYSIRWTRKYRDHPADVMVVMVTDDRQGYNGETIGIVLKYDFVSNTFMVSDHEGHFYGIQSVNDVKRLDRVDVINQPIAKVLFSHLDYIWLNDDIWVSEYRKMA